MIADPERTSGSSAGQDGTPVIAVDLGKSRCRVRAEDSGAVRVAQGAGAPGLAADGGVDRALESILGLLPRVVEHAAVVAVGAAGALAAPSGSRELAERLHEATGARVCVTSDVVTAHAGAFSGRGGVLLIAGTGATAFGVGDGFSRTVDGWGPELGDLGGGSWIGRRALRAALLMRAGLMQTSADLLDAVTRHTGDDPVGWLSGHPDTARRLASVAPLVLAAAESGDRQARAIVDEAVASLAASAVAAGWQDAPVVPHGGLTDSTFFAGLLRDALEHRGCTVRKAAGDALDGARLLAEDHDSPYERVVHRAG